MKIFKTTTVVVALAIPAVAGAMEFQTPGTLGMGRVGVARTTDAYAAFWNPAGLAFYEKPFSAKFNAGAGVTINESLADNIDKIGKLDTNNLSYDTAGKNIQQIQEQAVKSTAQAVQALAIIDDIDKSKGALTVNVDLALAFQYRNFAFGLGGASEIGAGNVKVDYANLRAGNSTSSTTSATQNISDLVKDMNAGSAPTITTNTQTYFNDTQWNQVVSSIKTAVPGVTDAEAATLANKMGQQFATTPPESGLTSDQLVSGLNLAATTFDGGSIDDNNSTVNLVGISLVEVPFAYGHKIDLGAAGKLGLGAALKVMQATVYGKQALIFKDFKDGTGDFITKVKDSKSDSTSFGVDLGALWRYEGINALGPINVALVAKNLNSPKFDAPVDSTNAIKYEDIKIKPQSRIGVALEPLSWLSIAADMDVTKNETVMKDINSQNIGAGLEAHWSYAALRLGMYKNLAETGGKPIITAGFGLGPRWFRLDVDGAASTATGEYDGTSYPREAKVEFGLSTTF